MHIYMDIYIYVHTEEEAVGPACWQPLFSVVLYVSNGGLWASVSVGRSFGACACNVLLPTTTIYIYIDRYKCRYRYRYRYIHSRGVYRYIDIHVCVCMYIYIYWAHTHTPALYLWFLFTQASRYTRVHLEANKGRDPEGFAGNLTVGTPELPKSSDCHDKLFCC